ncbi:MAG: AAA family ATPase [Oscillospiraceae bacterium]|nr:AAA family ATPase [Oscillospiraceae bacterium]
MDGNATPFDTKSKQKKKGGIPSVENNSKSLTVYEGRQLAEMYLPPVAFCVEGLLPHGLTFLGGPSKYGKSWMVLDLCVHVARGEPFWDLPVQQSEVLYLALEDSINRVRTRLLTVTEIVPPGLYFAIEAGTIEDGLCEQIREQVSLHPAIKLVVVDTFQIIRGGSNTDVSYAGDYIDVRAMKVLADELGIALVLVHHVRKQKDRDDPLNNLSGTTGIVGAADTSFVLDKDERTRDVAKLFCTGRDIEMRLLELEFDKETGTGRVLKDSLKEPTVLMPTEMRALVELMRERGSYSGGNQQLADLIAERVGKAVHPKGLKQMMNNCQYELARLGVTYWDHQSSNRRLVDVTYAAPASA